MGEADKKKKKAGLRFSQEQYDMLKRCSDAKDMTEWNEWRGKNPNKDVWLQSADLQSAYLEGVKLQNAFLWEAKLKRANLRESDLQGAQLMRAYLQGAEFGGAKLQGADFSRAIVDGETLIWRCEVDRRTKFEGVGLDAARIYPKIKQLLECNIRRMNWEEWYKWKDWFEYAPKEERNKLGQFFLRNTVGRFWSLSDYGRSTGLIIVAFLGFAFGFAIIYWLWGCIAPPGIIDYLFVDENGVKVARWIVPIRAVHFSVVIMTVGFTNMHANAHSIWAHILVSLQMVLGFVLLGAIVTRFAVLFTAGGPAGRFAKEDTKIKQDA
jgi:hypothetical protein